MHELSIAMGIVEGAFEEAARHSGERVAVVRLQLGQLSGVVREALLFSYDLACDGTPLAGSRLEIVEITAAVDCRECDAVRDTVSIQEMRCVICGTASSEVVRGRELMIVGLELEHEYSAAAG